MKKMKTKFFFRLFALTQIFLFVLLPFGAISPAQAAYDAVTYDDSISFSATLGEDGKVITNWSKYNHSESFNFYKVVRSSTKNNPVYPDDGYIYYTTNTNTLSYTDSSVPKGTSYYRICQVASSKRYCSQTVVTITKDSTNQCTAVNGGWSGWSAWSTCRNNTQTRSRTCNNPASSCGGANCTGDASQTQSCGSSGGDGCSVISWSPDASTVCSGQSFTQTSNCNSTRSIAGTKNCQSNTLSATITSPANNSVFHAPAKFTITANATGINPIRYVEFYRGTTFMGRDYSSPYQRAFSGVSESVYDFSVVAVDSKGVKAGSAPLRVTVVNDLPAVRITSPQNNANYNAPAGFILSAEAGDSDGTIRYVEFYRGTARIARDNSAPYQHAVRNLKNGTYDFSAVAVDNRGARVGSQAVRVNVGQANNVPPTVSISSPQNNSTYNTPATFSVTANASDLDGTISRVEFYQNNVKIGEDSASPYTFAVNGLTTGSYVFSAAAIDNRSARTVSQSINVVVRGAVQNVSPTISIAGPANNSSFNAPATFSVTANAFDSDGSIASVRFYRNDALLGEDRTSPYETTMSNLAAGSYRFYAMATDNLGASTNSTPININVQGTNPTTSAIIIDHNSTKLSQIPSQYIEAAKQQYRLSYGHTSHGSQVVSGINLIKGSAGSTYYYDSNFLFDTTPSGDLGNPDMTSWADRTRTMLRQSGNTRNAVMWSWCGQVSGATANNISTYLNLMSQLESEFPNVKFIYMTGHLDGSGETGNLHLRNEQIRKYVRDNNKILFDFADIESYNPDGAYFLNRGADDGNNYSGGNWATEWCSSHGSDPLCRQVSCAHSQSLNCNLKAGAFWWMMGRLAGWNGQ